MSPFQFNFKATFRITPQVLIVLSAAQAADPSENPYPPAVSSLDEVLATSTSLLKLIEAKLRQIFQETNFTTMLHARIINRPKSQSIIYRSVGPNGTTTYNQINDNSSNLTEEIVVYNNNVSYRYY